MTTGGCAGVGACAGAAAGFCGVWVLGFWVLGFWVLGLGVPGFGAVGCCVTVGRRAGVEAAGGLRRCCAARPCPWPGTVTIARPGWSTRCCTMPTWCWFAGPRQTCSPAPSTAVTPMEASTARATTAYQAREGTERSTVITRLLPETTGQVIPSRTGRTYTVYPLRNRACP